METENGFSTSVTIIVPARRGLIQEFEGRIWEELVGSGGPAEHAIFMKINVTLVASVSPSDTSLLAAVAVVRYWTVL